MCFFEVGILKKQCQTSFKLYQTSFKLYQTSFLGYLMPFETHGLVIKPARLFFKNHSYGISRNAFAATRKPELFGCRGFYRHIFRGDFEA